MRAIWSVVCIVAVTNMVAIGALAGWLRWTGRLDRDRVELLRETLAAPAGASRVEAALRRPAEPVGAAEATAPSGIPSAVRLTQIDAIRAMTETTRRELIAERDAIARRVERELAALAQDRAEFEAEVRARNDAVARENALRSDEQFRKTVDLLAWLPRQAKGTLIALVRSGETEQAVAYLDAMPSRSAQKILREFKTPAEQEIATHLVEQLRRYGTAEVEAFDAGGLLTAGAGSE